MRKREREEKELSSMTFLRPSPFQPKVYDSQKDLERLVGCDAGTNFDVTIFNGSDVASEENRKYYASLALDKYKIVENVELVDTGPISVKHIAPNVGPPNALLVHLNINAKAKPKPKPKAKKKDKPDAVVVKTFFCELIITSSEDVNLVSVRCLGLSSKLPEEAKTFGCLYCSHKNIHHPEETFSDGYHTGREGLFYFWFSKVKQLWECVQQCEESREIPTFPNPGVVYRGSDFTDSPSQYANEESRESPGFPNAGIVYLGSDIRDSPSQYATAALRLFNSARHENWEFVKHGSFSRSQPTLMGFITHINFNAKNLDDPEAEEFTFFAEVISHPTFLFATCCQLLCSSAQLSEKAEHHGCSYCPPCVHHPRGLLYMNGHIFRDY